MLASRAINLNRLEFSPVKEPFENGNNFPRKGTELPQPEGCVAYFKGI
jgi:hypothetical protein